MDRKSKLIASFLVFLITACNTSQPLDTSTIKENNNYKTKSIPSPAPTGGLLDKSKISDPPLIPKNVEKTKDYDTSGMKSPSFDHVPTSGGDLVPGSVTVIFKNDSKIRIDNLTKKISSNHDSYSKDLENILSKFKLEENSDLAVVLKNKTEDQLDEMQRRVQTKSLTEVPHLKSVQYLYFPEDSDTELISEELRKLPFVRTAYPTSMLSSSTIIPNTPITPYGNTSDIKSSIIPSDTGFSSSEANNWWWFNRYKVLEGWKIYASEFSSTPLTNNASGMNTDTNIQKPVVAVIDSGFDTGLNYVSGNSPNYLQGVEIGISPTAPIMGYNTDETSGEVSHGARVSSVLGSKIGPAFNTDLAGVIPGATILPIKLNTETTQSISSAIVYATNYDYYVNPSVRLDVINISIGKNVAPPNTPKIFVPIIHEPAIGTAVLYATQGGIGGDRDKSVVIAAGNNGINLDDYFSACTTTPPSGTTPGYPHCYDYGQIIVSGGNAAGTQVSRSHGKLVDLSAGSEDITSTTFNSSTGSRVYGPEGGTSLATPMVSATVAMMRKIAQHKGISINSDQARDIVTFTSTLAFERNTSTSYTNRIFRGRYLYDNTRNLPFRSITTGGSGVDQFAQIRELNVFNALSFVKNYTNGCTMIRLFNTDDIIYATTDTWANRFGDVSYYNDRFYRFNSGAIPTSQVVAFDTWNTSGGNGSYGYQIYKNGMLAKEYIKGVVTMYQPWTNPVNLYPAYNTVGVNNSQWIGYQTYTF